jgi:hypothetical protein
VTDEKKREELLPPAGMFGALNPAYRIKRRQRRIIEEIERARAGDHKVPTWVLGLILLVLLAGWLAVIVFA